MWTTITRRKQRPLSAGRGSRPLRGGASSPHGPLPPLPPNQAGRETKFRAIISALRRQALTYEDYSDDVVQATWQVVSQREGPIPRRDIQAAVFVRLDKEISAGLMSKNKIHRILQTIFRACFRLVPIVSCDTGLLEHPDQGLIGGDNKLLEPPDQELIEGDKENLAPRSEPQIVMSCELSPDVKSVQDMIRACHALIKLVAADAGLKMGASDWALFFERPNLGSAGLSKASQAPLQPISAAPQPSPEKPSSGVFGFLSAKELSKFRTKWCTREDEHVVEQCSGGHRDLNMGHLRRDPGSGPSYSYVPRACPNVALPSETSAYHNYCREGGSCRFAHSYEEINFHPSLYKTRKCAAGVKCPHRRFCPFLHPKTAAQDLSESVRITKMGTSASSYASSPGKVVDCRALREHTSSPATARDIGKGNVAPGSAPSPPKLGGTAPPPLQEQPVTPDLAQLLASLRRRGGDLILPMEKHTLLLRVVYKSLESHCPPAEPISEANMVLTVQQQCTTGDNPALQGFSRTKVRYAISLLKLSGCVRCMRRDAITADVLETLRLSLPLGVLGAGALQSEMFEQAGSRDPSGAAPPFVLLLPRDVQSYSDFAKKQNNFLQALANQESIHLSAAERRKILADAGSQPISVLAHAQSSSRFSSLDCQMRMPEARTPSLASLGADFDSSEERSLPTLLPSFLSSQISDSCTSGQVRPGRVVPRASVSEVGRSALSAAAPRYTGASCFAYASRPWAEVATGGANALPTSPLVRSAPRRDTSPGRNRFSDFSGLPPSVESSVLPTEGAEPIGPVRKADLCGEKYSYQFRAPTQSCSSFLFPRGYGLPAHFQAFSSSSPPNQAQRMGHGSHSSATESWQPGFDLRPCITGPTSSQLLDPCALGRMLASLNLSTHEGSAKEGNRNPSPTLAPDFEEEEQQQQQDAKDGAHGQYYNPHFF
jgi:hypothetical protein